MKKFTGLQLGVVAMVVMMQLHGANKPKAPNANRDGDTEMSGTSGEPLLQAVGGDSKMAVVVDNKQELDAFNKQGQAYFKAVRDGDVDALSAISNDKKEPWTDDCYYYDKCTLRTSNKEPNSPLWVAIDLAVKKSKKEALYQKRLNVITQILKQCTNRDVLFNLGCDNWCGVPACMCCCGFFGKCLYIWGGPVHKAAHENNTDLLGCLNDNKYPINAYTTCRTSRELTPVQIALRASAMEAIGWFLANGVSLGSADRCCIGKAKTALLRQHKYMVMCGNCC